MNKLFRIEAEICFESPIRSLPIISGYRPGFKFVGNSQTSGSIRLLTKDELHQGESGYAEISFISDKLLINVTTGSRFRFFEGPIEIGSGEVKRIVGYL